jgi:hypothetical protein
MGWPKRSSTNKFTPQESLAREEANQLAPMKQKRLHTEKQKLHSTNNLHRKNYVSYSRFFLTCDRFFFMPITGHVMFYYWLYCVVE